jgi:hypothetical protein
MAMPRPPMIDDDGTGTTGTVLNNAWYQALCNAIDTGAISPPVARTDAANTFTSTQTFQGPSGEVRFVDTSAPADARMFRILNSSQILFFDTVNDAVTLEQTIPLQLYRNGDARIAKDIYEKARPTPMGHWINIPFSAANFTANVGTWTVEAPDIYVQAYTLIGKTMTYAFGIASTSVTGSPAALKVALPSGVVVGPNSMYAPCNITDNGARTFGSLSAGQNGTVVNIQLDLFGGLTFATATNTTHVFGQITFQIQ